MRIAVDSSTLISLAWAGQLDLLSCSPVPLVVPDDVRREAVVEGLARGHPDAVAIEWAIKALPDGTSETGSTPTGSPTVDHAVLEAGRVHGALLTNDLALGRRAANVGMRWLRTADLVVLCVRAGEVSKARGAAALRALRDARRITEDLLDAYLEELP